MDSPLCILTIDDEQIVLDSVQKHLRKEDFRLLSALSAKEALKLMDENQVDIVLTDLMMPEIDGLDLLKLMRSKAPRTPVIMITGYATINTALQATHLGAFDYIAKPFTRSELLSVINRAVQLVRATDERTNLAPTDGQESLDRIPDRENNQTIGEYGWKRLEDDGTVVLGVERSFVESVGRIQNIFLPAKGDEIRQGGVYLRIFSADLLSHTVLSPLSGMVVDVNESCIGHPQALVERAGEEWLVRLKPSKFEFEIKELGL
jgi:FixJ family two-component response regulator/glycine cleavage system H lipoate-binding protein